MADTYPVRFPAQMRQHLRALRKKRGLTQANVATLIGVSQARVAEIEANPGLVSFEQLMQFLSALGVTVTLCEASRLSDDAKGETQSRTSTTGHEPTHKASAASKGTGVDPKVLEAVGGLEQVRKALESVGRIEQARKTIESVGGLEQARKAIESVGGLEQARKAPEASSDSKALHKAMENLNSLSSYRNLLVHPKKGGW
jgi:transcriptional regulator with XRE-family HTH domain